MNFSEHAIAFDCVEEQLLGVVSLPAQASDIGVLVIVGGPQYRVGSHRQFVLLARYLAASGYPVLRFDVRGMGDSSGQFPGELNRRNAERAKALFDADVIGAAELQRRQSEYQISVAETRAAADQLQLLGVSSAAIARLGSEGAVDSVVPVVATLGGAVVERRLAQGQVVQPADVLFVVADLSRLWAVAEVPEQQVSQVRTGQTVTIEVPALGNEKLTGKLIFVSQTINPETRTVLVRTELDNRDGRLKPAMLASMLIEGKPVNRMVIVASAVVRENDEDHVFIAEPEDVFRLVPVRLGRRRAGSAWCFPASRGRSGW